MSSLISILIVLVFGFLNNVKSTNQLSEIIHTIPRDVKTIHQLGSPRSGSTFQWYVLCSILRLLYPYRTDCNRIRAGKEYNLYKGHIIADINYVRKRDKKYRKMKMYFFISQDKNYHDLANELRLLNDSNNIILYTQEYDDLVLRDTSILEDYIKIFSMSKNLTSELYQHIRYWEILRRCCGYQKSALYVNTLKKNLSFPVDYKVFQTKEYPACEMYNINQVENLFLQTNLSRRFPGDLFLTYSGGYFQQKEIKYTRIYKGYCQQTLNLLDSGKNSHFLLLNTSRTSI
jgi:hypothetical protein